MYIGCVKIIRELRNIYPEKSVKGNVSDLKTFKTLEILTTHF